MIRPTFTEATDAAEALNLTRHGLLQAAREGKLVAWLQPETNPQRPFIVRAGKRQPTAESTGRKLAMPDGQFLVFEHDAMVNLRGNGCLDLSVLTEQNHALLLSAYRGHDGVTVELMPGVVLGDGAGNFYEVASEGPRTMALVGFMTKDLEALRAAHDAEPAASQEPVNKQTPSGSSEQGQAKVVKNTTKGKRRDILAPVLEYAQSLCKNPFDTSEVWGVMLNLGKKHFPTYLHHEGEAIAYSVGDETKLFTRKKLKDRLRGQRLKPSV
jgi:hypothetical protein